MKFREIKLYRSTAYIGEISTKHRSKKFNDAIADTVNHFLGVVLLDNKDKKWDYVKVSSWPDSGSVFLIPSCSDVKRRIENSFIHLRVSEINKMFSEGSDETVVNNELLISEIEKMIFSMICDKFSQAVNGDSLLKSIGVHKLELYEYDNDHPVAVFYLEKGSQ